jgi:hypothetical protein
MKASIKPNRTTIKTFNRTNSNKDLYMVSNIKELAKELKK